MSFLYHSCGHCSCGGMCWNVPADVSFCNTKYSITSSSHTHFFLVFRENAAGCNGAGSQKKSRKPEVALSINVGVFR